MLSVVLGSVTPIGIAFDGPLWLGIAVDGGAELTPRVELTTSPYAFQAKSVDDDAVTSAKISDGTVTSADIADGTVTGADIADGTIAAADILDGTITAADVAAAQVVKSVNTLTDAVTLAAGSNVTITPAGNTLTFASSAAGGNNLDMAYDEGGAGVGRTITADAGAVDIAGADGLTVSGKVGIGTTAPNNLLSLNDAAAANTFLQVTNSATGTTGTDGTLLGIDATGNSALVNQEATDLDLYTSNTPRLKIKANGDVGIGTTSPAAGQKLHVSGNIRLDDGANDNTISGGIAGIGSINLRDNATGGMTFEHTESYQWSLGGTERMRLVNAGSLGIGTTSPDVRLDIVGDPNGAVRISDTDADVTAKSLSIVGTQNTNADGLWRVIGGSANGTDNLVDIGGGWAGFDAASIIRLYTASATNTDTGTERMRIAGNGNVGIGTTSPTAQLHVTGTNLGTTASMQVGTNFGSAVAPAREDMSILLYDAGATNWAGLSASGPGDIYFKTGTSGTPDAAMVISSTQNVGIGTTSPTALLEVAGDLLVGGPTAANKAVYSSANAHLRLLSGNTWRTDGAHADRRGYG